jgi:uncharacterized coiled-coil protein SlyX
MGKLQELKNLETERDAAYLECDQLRDKLGAAQDIIRFNAELRATEKAALTKRVAEQRRALRQMNRAVVERNLRLDDLHHRFTVLQRQTSMLHKHYDAQLATLDQENARLRDEAGQKRRWWQT